MAKEKLRKVANDILVKSLEKRKEKKLQHTLNFDSLNKSGYLDDQYRSFNNNILPGLDGTQYYSSSNVYCDNCNQKHHKNGNITYFHSVLTPVILKPGSNRVIALAPEFITPQDGGEKQDCENAAAKRWLRVKGSWLKQLGVTITADDLYCKPPLCELMLKEGLDFILVCKEESHKTLYEYVELQKEDIRTMKVSRWVGKRYLVDTYRFINGLFVPHCFGISGREIQINPSNTSFTRNFFPGYTRTDSIFLL